MLKRFALGLAVFLGILALAPAAPLAPRGSLARADTPVRAPGLVRSVEAVGMTVSDLDRSVQFFTTVLSFEKVSETEVWGEPYEHLAGVFGMRARVARLRLGDEQIEVTEYLVPRGRPIAPGMRSNDLSFQHVAIVVSDMDRAYRRLREHRVEHASTGPQRLPDWNPSAAGIEAFYFKDPDGHVLEVIAFPPGKGAARWHRPTDRLFLGIDHTAIVVSDTQASLALYRDLLGLELAGESLNHGTEQEHLNNVFGARVRITALRAPAGPGIEFLEYLAPRDGRPAPADLRANDLAHWQTVLATADTEEAGRRLAAGRVALVSPGTVALPDGKLGFGRAVLVRDRDGHALQLVQAGPQTGSLR